MPDDAVKSGYKFTNQTIGQYPTLSLLHAKLKSIELSDTVKSGKNPIDKQKQQEKAQITLKQIWDEWMAIADIKPITRLKLAGMYNNHISKLANKPIQLLDDKIAWDTIIQPILTAGNKTQARIVMSKLKQLSRFAYETHLIDKDSFDRLIIPSEYKVKKVRERTLSVDELTHFLHALEL